MSDLRSRVIEIIADVLELDPDERPVLESETEGQLLAAWDSARHVEIIVALEDAFDVHVAPEDIARLNHVRKIVEYLQNSSSEGS